VFFGVFTATIVGVGQSFILGAIGYLIIKRNFLGAEGLNALSRLVIEITLPLLIFCRLIRDFDPGLYPQWWIFPLLSIAITVVALAIGFLFIGFSQKIQEKLQFLSLVSFQNSGYLPLVLFAAILPKDKADVMFIYLFLFLLGFNLLMFSFGTYLLTYSKSKKFDWWSLLNPPVIATLAGLFVVFLGVSKFIPGFVLKPLEMTGDCTLPLATFIVGGNIAAIRCARSYNKAIALMVLVKLVILPVMGLWLVYQFKLPDLLGLLIVMQLAMPPATNLSVIVSQYKQEDCLVSQGVFYGHILSIVTIPLFLSLYFAISMLK
jgi:predicted permease